MSLIPVNNMSCLEKFTPSSIFPHKVKCGVETEDGGFVEYQIYIRISVWIAYLFWGCDYLC